ncbi:uncharacterized protein LOC111643516 [Copidosoma floridanum]|uniref:uncharacterized protein LOC111643516 n=1 Tax=Copidosoma floridanum TaxID=29053 RepID=UPI000C6FB729|nr:uncharacterized protein LOC111643516 [Copidosoma floridanum]
MVGARRQLEAEDTESLMEEEEWAKIIQKIDVHVKEDMGGKRFARRLEVGGSGPALQERSKKEKVFASFVDLTAAFDTVNREMLWEVIEEEGISKFSIERRKELYEETMVTSLKGVMQECVLSPILFCICIAALEKEYKNRNVGGVVIGGIRVWSLAYADDLVLLALNREAVLDMLGVLKRFLEGRDLILSVVKTKILVFNKGRNSWKEKWLYKGEEMEEVKSVKYLGFIFNREANFKDHIEELQKKKDYFGEKSVEAGGKKV